MAVSVFSGGENMKNEKNDRRIRYTKMVLKQSLLDLMKVQSINKITVKDICEKADINRGTFYSHYDDAYDLLEQIENELREKIEETLTKHNTTTMFSLNFITEIFECIKENDALCKVLISEHGDIDFIKKIIYIAHDRFIDDCAHSFSAADKSHYEYIYDYIANGCVGMVRRWAQNGFKENAPEMAELAAQISYKGLEFFKHLDIR